MDEPVLIPPKRSRKRVDPRGILEDLAADPETAPALRFRVACKLLALDQREAALSKTANNGAADDRPDEVTRRALEIAAARNEGAVN